MAKFRSDEPNQFGYRLSSHVRTSWLLVSIAVHGAAVTAAIGFSAYTASQPVPPVAQIEIQQQLASVAMPLQAVPMLDVMSEEIVESVAVPELEVSEQPVLEKPAEPVMPPDVIPSPTEVMRQLATDRVRAKPAKPKTVPVEVVEPAVEPAVEPVPQVASVAQEYVEAQRSDNKPPRYPNKERRLSREGKVTVRVSIAVNGSVTGVSLLEESRYEGFNREARKAAHKWKFTPAMRGGVAVATVIDIEVVFRLSDPK
ncbi:MAG: protein TonB [Hyphomicrobiaceae bacterium]